MTSTDPHWLTGQYVDEDSPPWILGMNKSYFLLVMKIIMYYVVFFSLLTINLLALSVSLQCNRGTNKQTYAAIYAFLFGPIYLIFNYYFVRVLGTGQTCQFSDTNPFPYLSK